MGLLAKPLDLWASPSHPHNYERIQRTQQQSGCATGQNSDSHRRRTFRRGRKSSGRKRTAILVCAAPNIEEDSTILCDVGQGSTESKIREKPRIMKKLAIMFLAFGLLSTTLPPYATGTVNNDVFWKDLAGNPNYAQGGNISMFGNTYYW